MNTFRNIWERIVMWILVPAYALYILYKMCTSPSQPPMIFDATFWVVSLPCLIIILFLVAISAGISSDL